MKKGFFGKVLLTVCILLGCIVGYGFVQMTGTGGGTIYNIISRTKDNTLDKEKDSVFFSSDGTNLDVTIMPTQKIQENNMVLESITNDSFIENELNEIKEIKTTITTNPTLTPKPLEEVKAIEEKETMGQNLLVTPIETKNLQIEKVLEDKEKEIDKKQEEVKKEENEVSQSIVEEIKQEEIEEKELNVTGILAKGIKEKIANQQEEIEKKEIQESKMRENEMVAERTRENQKEIEKEEKEIKEDTKVVEKVGEQNKIIDTKTESEQVFTYPTEIFGQTPIVNRSDDYVTYFEFALDLIDTVEPEVKQKGLSETALFAKFVVKALICGVDVKKIQINTPISRSEAALALWLTAQIMEEKGSSTVGGISYITDLENCSSSEKKAIAYLYEQGVLSGYQTAGQTFLPSKALRTKEGEDWMAKIKQCWK